MPVCRKLLIIIMALAYISTSDVCLFEALDITFCGYRGKKSKLWVYLTTLDKTLNRKNPKLMKKII